MSKQTNKLSLLSLLFLFLFISNSCEKEDLFDENKTTKITTGTTSRKANVVMIKQEKIVLDSLFEKDPSSIYSKEKFYNYPGKYTEKRTIFLQNSEVLKYHNFNRFFRDEMIISKNVFSDIGEYINFSTYEENLDNDYVYQTILEAYIKDLSFFNGDKNKCFINYLKGKLKTTNYEERNKVYSTSVNYLTYNYNSFLYDSEMPTEYIKTSEYLTRNTLESNNEVLSMFYDTSFDVAENIIKYNKLARTFRYETSDSSKQNTFIKGQIILDAQSFQLNNSKNIENAYIQVNDMEESFEETRESLIAYAENNQMWDVADYYDSMPNPYAGSNTYNYLANSPKMKYNAVETNSFATLYKMNNGAVILKTNQSVYDNELDQVLEKVNPNQKERWYIKSSELGQWENLIIPTDTDPEKLLWNVVEGLDSIGKGIYRYVLFTEDALILIKGKDLDGNTVNKLQKQMAAGFLLLSVIPVTKLTKGIKFFKPVVELGKDVKTWKILVKNSNHVSIRSVKEIPSRIFQIFEKYAPGTSDYIQEALKKGENEDIIYVVSDQIKEISEKINRKLSWQEIKILFIRGNNFNKTAIKKYEKDFCEIVLETKKRVDTYLHGEAIISRKATDIDNITEMTWRKYCNELVTKYKVGTLTKSKKIKNQVRLTGKYYLEIPLSNKQAKNIDRFKEIAKTYGRENGGIEIIFLAE